MWSIQVLLVDDIKAGTNPTHEGDDLSCSVPGDVKYPTTLVHLLYEAATLVSLASFCRFPV